MGGADNYHSMDIGKNSPFVKSGVRFWKQDNEGPKLTFFTADRCAIY
jgi:hypothetical protein